MARKLSGPTAIIVDRPIAASIEYRPPTQSQNPNVLAASMPNFVTPAMLVETATKCLATAASDPSFVTSQARAVAALVIVSSVVKVLEEMMNSVSAASRSCVASLKSAPSTLATKRNVIERSLNGRNAR